MIQDATHIPVSVWGLPFSAGSTGISVAEMQ